MSQFFHLLAAMFAASIPGPLTLPSAAPRNIRRTAHGVKGHRALMNDGYTGRHHASHGGQAIAIMDRLIKKNHG